MRKALTAILVSTALVTSGCSKNPTFPDNVLLRINPVQCEQTAWEADYNTHPENYSNLKPSQDLKILNAYYQYKGVDILETSKRPISPPGMPPCPDCGCPRGYSITAKVLEKDAQVLIGDGFSQF